jgi:hypothetical protein
MWQKRLAILLLNAPFLCASCTGKNADPVATGDADSEDPIWHFEPITLSAGEPADMTLTDVWGRSDGAVFIVGWFGAIFTNRVTVANPEGLWVEMESNTVQNLTAIWGVENGSRFRQRNVDGEMLAVGWNGTVLHYNPNPTMKQSPVPEDGVWQVIAGPGGELVPKTKVDPKCPDFDGDGIPDDGGGATAGGADGWWSPDATCKAGPAGSCDDNCRTVANGPLRPIRDVNIDACLQSGVDAAYGAARNQVDGDSDGFGLDCDANDSTANTRAPFRPALFDVWATAANGQLVVVAVGENGALITYNGVDAASPVVPPARAITDRAAWVAQESLTYRFDNDCDVATPVGTMCAGAVRLPPSCPAQCHPFRTNCACPSDGGQCCDAAASTGVGCGDASCGAVTNACGADAANPGNCSTDCPGCLRRMDKTLHSIASDGTNVVVVGAGGVVIKLSIDLASPASLAATWVRPDCVPMPYPLDGRPKLTAVAQRDGVFQAIGAGGSYAAIDPAAGGCGLTTMPADATVPPAFLASLFPLWGNHAYAVGDSGIFLELNGSGPCTPRGTGPVRVIPTKLPQNLNALWVTWVDNVERVWFVGATGTVVRAGCYP